jgi:hypothetical protein
MVRGPSRMESSSDSRTKAQAIQRLHELETNLDFDKLVALEDLINTNVLKAQTYLCLLEDEEIRKVWVRKRLTELGFP